jgi:hypothetical protein
MCISKQTMFYTLNTYNKNDFKNVRSGEEGKGE